MGNTGHKKTGARGVRSKRTQIPKPANPCAKCPEREKAALGVCNGGFGICKENLNYQRRLWELKNEKGE